MSERIVETFLELARVHPEQSAIVLGEAAPHSRASIVTEAKRLATWLDDVAPDAATIITIGASGPGFWAATLAVFGTGRRLLPLPVPSLGEGRPERASSTLASAFGAAAIIMHDGAIEAASHGERDDEAARLRQRQILPTPALATHALPTMRACGGETTEEASARDVPAQTDQHVRRDQTDRSTWSSRLDRGASASLLLRSSGTTGRARVVLRGAAALDRVAATLADVLDVDERDTIASHLPMHHSYGFEHAVLLPLITGASVRVMERFAPDRLFAALRHGATVLPTVPVILQALAELAPASHRLRVVLSAGSPLPPFVRDRFEGAWGVPVRNLYGASELGTIALTQGDGDRAVPGVSIRVCEPADRDQPSEQPLDHLVDLAPGEVGELCVSSDAMFSGYLDADGMLDRRRIVDGHLRTGDAGTIDGAGRVVLRGRLRLQLDVGGLKVEPEAIEAILAEHPLVREAVVVPLPMSESLTRLRAVVVPRRAAALDDASDLRAFLRQRVAAHEVPRVIDFVDELPRSASGKVLRGGIV